MSEFTREYCKNRASKHQRLTAMTFRHIWEVKDLYLRHAWSFSTAAKDRLRTLELRHEMHAQIAADYVRMALLLPQVENE